MFPTADEEMSWDNSTTPPALRKMTDEEVDDELHSALADTKLFDTEDDLDDIDLTSIDSDDVFFDGSILEVSINRKRRFSRRNILRQQLTRKYNQHEDTSEDSSDSKADDGEAENREADDESEEVREQHRSDNPSSRPRRNVKRVDYAILHSEGRWER